MSFRLKAAIIAAFTLSAAAAVTASDMSSASEASLSTVSLPETAALASAPTAGTKPAVVFAAPQEVAQSLDSGPKAGSNFSTDIEPKAETLAALVDAQGAPEDVEGDMKCLAGAVYFESKGETLVGELAVARVIITRA